MKKETEDLKTLCDFMRYAVSRFNEANLHFGHGTTTAFDEAAFLIMETLNLPPDTQLDPFWNARLTKTEREKVADIIEARITTRKPAPYLLNRAYIQGIPFYVDERVIVPRSFIGELMMTDGLPLRRQAEDIETVLDLCTGSGCLAILAAHAFPNATIDAVELSFDAGEVARRNIAQSGMGNRITLFEGDLFGPVEGRTYDLIISNPPYVDAEGMSLLTPEYKHEPAMALQAGADGLDIVRRLVKEAPDHLNFDGGMVVEIGRCRPAFEEAFSSLPVIWLETELSQDEVFWINRSDF